MLHLLGGIMHDGSNGGSAAFDMLLIAELLPEWDLQVFFKYFFHENLSY